MSNITESTSILEKVLYIGIPIISLIFCFMLISIIISQITQNHQNVNKLKESLNNTNDEDICPF